jgi:hypothetical protein
MELEKRRPLVSSRKVQASKQKSQFGLFFVLTQAVLVSGSTALVCCVSRSALKADLGSASAWASSSLPCDSS